MVPNETGASDLSPNATVQPLNRAVGTTAVGADSRCCDKPALPTHIRVQGKHWKGGCGRWSLNSPPCWCLCGNAIQMWAYILQIERKIQVTMWKTITIKCQPTDTTKTLGTDLANTGSIGFPSITFACCQYGVLKIDNCSLGTQEELECRIQLTNYYN